MFGIGIFEILIIAVVCLIAFGPGELPAVMRKLAGYYRRFLQLRDEFRFDLLSGDEGEGKEMKRALDLVSKQPDAKTDDRKS